MLSFGKALAAEFTRDPAAGREAGGHRATGVESGDEERGGAAYVPELGWQPRAVSSKGRGMFPGVSTGRGLREGLWEGAHPRACV